MSSISPYQLPLFLAEKRCTKCGQVKPLDDFHVQAHGRGGRRSHCKACRHKPRPPRYAIRAGGPRDEVRVLRRDGLKRCAGCAGIKAFDSFSRRKSSADGLHSYCRSCCKVRQADWIGRNPDYGMLYRLRVAEDRCEYGKRYREKNAERERARHRAYIDAHRDELAARRKSYWQQHRERLCAKYRAWYASDPDKARLLGRERMRRRRELQPDAVKAYNAQWRKEHPEHRQAAYRRRYQKHKLRYFAAARKRRALRLHAEGSYTEQEWRELCRHYDDVCLACGSAGPLTADHVVPLSRGGTDSIGNIQPLCKPCNSRKGIKTTDYRTRPR